MGSCSEHLMMMTSLINSLEAKKEGAVITCCDVVKCFDTLYLSDMSYFLAKNEACLKATKVFQKLTDTNMLKVQGSEKMFTITNGVGQGGIVAPRLASAGTTEVLERKFETHPSPLMYNGVNIILDGFVDDSKVTDTTTEGAKASGVIITKSLDEMALKAHKDKTVQIVVGHGDYIKKMKAELAENPTVIQGFEVKRVDQEKYLGMLVTSSGVKEMITRNIKAKKAKVIPAAQGLRRLIRNPVLMRIGGVKSASVMIQAKLVPMALYGAESWLNIDKDQIQELEGMMAMAIRKVLSLPKSTNYEAMLHEIQGIHMEQWVDALKMNMVTKLMHVKGEGRLYKVLREELLEGVKGGVIEEMEKLSKKYRIPHVALHFVKAEDISKAVRTMSKEKICNAIMLLKSIPMVPHYRKVEHEHHRFDVSRARAITCFNTGNLVFKDTCPNMFRARDQGNRDCLEPACGGRDSYLHVRYECKFYTTKYVDTGKPVWDNAEYILALNRERIRRWRTPLVIVAPL